MSISECKVGLLRVVCAVIGSGLGMAAWHSAVAAPYPSAEPSSPYLTVEDAQAQQQQPAEAAAKEGVAALQFRGHKGTVRAVTFAPDGKTVATAGADGTVRLWDVATGQQTLTLEQPGEAVSLAFSHDGKMLAAGSAGSEGALTLWDPATGRLTFRHSHDGKWPGTVTLVKDGRGGVAIMVGIERCSIQGFYVQHGLGRSLATGLGGKAAVTAMARSKLDLAAYGDGDGAVYLSHPGGRIERLRGPAKGGVRGMVFLCGGTQLGVIDGGRGVSMVDVSTGKQEAAFVGAETVRALAASPDGRDVATAAASGEVRLWDAVTRVEKRWFSLGKRSVNALAFSPDGKRLAAGGEDGKGVVWDLMSGEPLPYLRLAMNDLASLWADLASVEGDKSYAAARVLRADPDRSVPYLRQRLALATRDPVADSKEAQKLIADLDADKYETRNRASKELERLGEHAESALRAALARSPSAEAKRRLEQLLQLLDGDRALTPEEQRAVRAVRVLEQANNPDARRVLRGGWRRGRPAGA